VDQYIQAIITTFSLVNPLVCGVMFAHATQGKSNGEQLRDATVTVLIVAGILSLVAVVGSQLLKVFGISFDAFQVAGGLVLIWMGFLMLQGTPSPTANSEGHSDPASLTPLIVFAASPGTITGVITISVAHSEGLFPVTALVAVIVTLAITWLIMIMAARSMGKDKKSLMQDVGSRFMGLMVLAMGVQFALSGIKTFLHG
jgi:multiple antibiotic resistance protein